MSSSTETWLLPPFTSSNSSVSKQVNSLSSSIPDPPLYAPVESSAPRGSRKLASTSSSTSAAAASPSSATAPKRSLTALRQQKAWDLAIAPAKSVPMQGFMVYMSGGGVQIFSLMIVGQLIKGALGGMMNVNKTFEPLEQSQEATSDAAATTASAVGPPRSSSSTSRQQDFTLQKIVHCLAQCLLLALGLYKCHSMGLLPTHDSDWLAFKRQKMPLEVSDASLGGWWQE